MSNQIQFELASPQKSHFNKPVAMVTVPGSSGAYGVLVGHAPMVTGVGAGVIEIYENDDSTITERLFITGGYCEVSATRCTVMADKILPLKSLNRADIEAELKDLFAQSDALGAEESRDALEAQIVIAQAKLQAVAA